VKYHNLIIDHDGATSYVPASHGGDAANGRWVDIPVDKWGTKGNFVLEFTDSGTSAACHLEGSLDGGTVWHILATVTLATGVPATPAIMTLQLTGTVEAVQQEVTLWPLMRANYVKGTGTYPDINAWLVL